MQRVMVNGRWPLWVADHQAPLWTRPDGWEAARLDAMAEVIGHGSTVYYCGAEQGDMPALLASWGARLVLIEPGERVWANIRAVWDANGLDEPAACWPGFAYDVTRSDDGVALGWPESSNGPVIDDHGFRSFTERPEIPSIRLDHLEDRLGTMNLPTDISIDVEGAEWRVLAGAERIMRWRRPRLWVSVHPEFMYAQFGEYAYDLRKWIRGFGYTETLLSYEHEVHLLYTPEETP